MPYALTDVLSARHDRLRRALADRQLDALIVTHLPNVFYLTNFAGSTAIVVVTGERLFLVTDFRYVTAVEEAWASPSACPGASLVRVETTYDDTLISLLISLGCARIGFEAAHVPFAQHGRWASDIDRRASNVERQPGGGVSGEQGSSSGVGISSENARWPVSLVPTERVVEGLRVRKDAHEVATLRRAAAMLSGAFDRIAAEVKTGASERQVAARIDWVMKDVGFDRPAFDTIVASGPNGALPHAHPGDRRLAAGDLVVLDFGGSYDGYCVDLTRTVALGRADEKVRAVYGAVVAAHQAGVNASRVGATARDVDRAARGTLERLGFGEFFGHGTGHGLGIEVHEEPWIVRTRPSEAAAGGGPRHEDVPIESEMVYTVEPGVYLPGWGGVRLEDDILVTPEGPQLLTEAPRDLLVL